MWEEDWDIKAFKKEIYLGESWKKSDFRKIGLFDKKYNINWKGKKSLWSYQGYIVYINLFVVEKELYHIIFIPTKYITYL